jgi:hypothetical protein
MGHGDSLRPHRMLLGIDELADDGVIKIGDLFVSGVVF